MDLTQAGQNRSLALLAPRPCGRGRAAPPTRRTRFSACRAPLVFVLSVAAALAPASRAGAGPWQGTEALVEGVRHVQNPAEPASGAVRQELVELWRLGGESDDEGEFFGVIGDIVLGEGGEVYVLDRQLTEVKVFSADGEYLRTLGREGEGPGEFRNPSDLLLLPGETIGVVQMMPARIELLTPDGDPAGTFPLPASEEGGMRQLAGAEFRGGSLVLMGASMQFEEGEVRRTQRLVGLDLEGHERAEFLRRESKLEMANMIIRERDVFGQRWVLGPDGRVSATEWDYEIPVYAPDGTLDHVITRAFEPYVRSDEEVEAVRRRMASRIQIRGPNHPPQFEVAPTEPAVRWMERTDDGSLWVLNARAFKTQRQGEIGPFDVFDPQGRFVRQVTLEGTCDLEQDRLVLAGDRLFVITQFWSAVAAWTGGGQEEDAGEDLVPMEVVCYRFAPPAPSGR